MNSGPSQRPRHGLPPEAALERWSDPARYADMDQFSDAWMSVSTAAGHPPSEKELRHRAYVERREPLEKAFLQKLKEGVILASGIPKGGLAREAIHSSLWDVLEIDFGFETIFGGGRVFEAPEFFEPSAVPTNTAYIPAWMEESPQPTTDAFTHDPTYEHVSYRGREFRFGPIQSKVIRLLHEAARNGTPWVKGKWLLGEAGSQQTKIHDLFKSQPDWTALVESDRKGSYRLRL